MGCALRHRSDKTPTEARRPMKPGSAVVRAAAGVLLTLLAAGAGAEVQLSTQVQRVEAVIEDGRMQTRLVDADLVAPGDELRYAITFTNSSRVALPPGIVVITLPIPEGAAYMHGSAGGRGSRIRFSVDGGATFLPIDELTNSEDIVPHPAFAVEVQALEWTYHRRLPPGALGQVWFHVRMVSTSAQLPNTIR